MKTALTDLLLALDRVQNEHDEVCDMVVRDVLRRVKAKRAYAWLHRERPDDIGERFVTVLEIPPANSPLTAVRVSIVADKQKRRGH